MKASLKMHIIIKAYTCNTSKAFYEPPYKHLHEYYSSHKINA